MFFFKNDLNEKIQNWKLHKEDFDLNLAIKYFRQIADAINFLHTKNPRVIHRDLKPKNIFLKSDEVIKVGDFGVSTFLKNAPIESNELLSEQTYVGTSCYRAPEVLSLSDYNESIDIWAFACIIFECIKFELAFPLAKQRDLIDFFKSIKSSSLSHIPDLELDSKYEKLSQLYKE